MSFEVVIGIALGLRDDDRFWNIVHPEWGCGLWYAVTTPLLMCQAITLFDGAFTVESFFFALWSNLISTTLQALPRLARRAEIIPQ